MDLLNGVAALHGVADVIQTVRIGGDEALGDQVLFEYFRAGGLAGFEAADGFSDGLFEGTADRHHFAHRFHLGAEDWFGAGEFLKLPARDLGDHVVNGRFKASGGETGDVVLDFVEAVADGELGGDVGGGKAGRFGGELGTAGEARSDLDDDHVAAFPSCGAS